jgi:acyl-CoA synthetase (AMP-forming)/AMP-acid ligase II
MANSVAHWLIDAGVKNGDRIAFILENSLEYVVTYYGILKSGAVTVSLNTDLKPDGLNSLLAELEPAVIITNNRFERLLKASDQALIQRSKLVIHNPKLTWDSNGFKVFSFDELLISHSVDFALRPAPCALDPEALASIIYTSGSTGKPKGVMLSHKNIVSNTHSICNYLGLNDKDIQMWFSLFSM